MVVTLLLVFLLMYFRVIPVERTNYGKMTWFQYHSGKFEEAKISSEEFLKKNPKSAIGWSMHGLIHLGLRDTLNGERYLEKAYQLNPEQYLVLFRLGKYENQKGNYVRGNQLIRKAIDLKPSKKNSYEKYLVFVQQD